MSRELYCWLAIGLLMWAWAFTVQGVTLAWDEPDDPTISGYRLYWGTISGAYTQSSDAGPSTQESVSDDQFAYGATYFFVARSYNVAGLESIDSNEVQWTRPALPTPTPTPAPPQNLHFQLIVIKGSGSGQYEVGTLVLVTADKPPHRYAFSRWDGDWIILANPFLKQTTATIPSMDTSIEALYEPRKP